MNERIQELAGQAEEYANSSQPYEKIKNKAWIDVYDEKFAELIVQECIDLVPWASICAKIKKHFGVE